MSEEDRLGYGSDGTDNIKEHRFFDEINWQSLEQRQFPPPFIPEISEKFLLGTDTPVYSGLRHCIDELTNFSSVNSELSADEQKYFENWDFVSSNTLRVELGLANAMLQLEKNVKAQQILGMHAHSVSNSSR